MSNRDRLVEAASDLFHRNGYRATSTGEILREAGVARSNLYYHFEGKVELAHAVLERWLRVYDAELVAPSLGRSELPPLERVAASVSVAGNPVAGHLDEGRRDLAPGGRLLRWHTGRHPD